MDKLQGEDRAKYLLPLIKSADVGLGLMLQQKILKGNGGYEARRAIWQKAVLGEQWQALVRPNLPLSHVLLMLPTAPTFALCGRRVAGASNATLGTQLGLVSHFSRLQWRAAGANAVALRFADSPLTSPAVARKRAIGPAGISREVL